MIPSFFPIASNQGPSFSPLHLSPRRVRGSKKVSLTANQEGYVGECVRSLPWCSHQARNLSESLQPPHKMPAQWLPVAWHLKSLTGFVRFVLDSTEAPNRQEDLSACSKMHYAHSCKHTFLMYSFYLKYVSLLSKPTQIFLILYSLNIY